MVRHAHRLDPVAVAANVDQQGVHPGGHPGFENEVVERGLGRFGIEQNDPVAIDGQSRFDLVGEFPEAVQQFAADPANRPLGTGAAIEKSIVGQDERIRRGSAKKAIALDKGRPGAEARGGNRRGNPRGPAADNGHIETLPAAGGLAKIRGGHSVCARR